MRIKSIEFQNNPILGNLNLNFTSPEGNIIDTIIFAGENGCGKSTILNSIYDFSLFTVNASEFEERRIFTFEFNAEEISILQKNISVATPIKFAEHDVQNEFTISFQFPWKDWNNITTHYKFQNGGDIYAISSSVFHEQNIKPLFSSIFSDVEIHFSPAIITATTSIELDEKMSTSKKTSTSLATEITQMLIDVHSSDASDYLEYANNHIGTPIESKDLYKRTNRFKDAFSFMFEKKSYKGIKNIAGTKAVIFEENGIEIPINKLSSGEKQIVFRGSFLLKDQKSNFGTLVLIDEPEISLHPTWQLKILEYYKKLFTNVDGKQTSQIFVVTHSPFIIHNNNRYNDKIIILKKDKEGNIITQDSQEFYNWSPSSIVEKAFDIEFYKNGDIPLIITEGKTDWKHLKNAITKFTEQNKFTDLKFKFLEFDDDTTVTGDSDLRKICNSLSKIPKDKPVICIFDRDIPETIKTMHDDFKGFKAWGNNTFSFCIPIPAHRTDYRYVTIESYYTNDEIRTTDNNGRRIFLSSEFSERSGKHTVNQLINCTNNSYLRGNTDEVNSKIVDSNVYDENENNIALSKSDFANYIFANQKEFSTFDVSEFEAVFNIIEQIIKNNI